MQLTNKQTDAGITILIKVTEVDKIGLFVHTTKLNCY